MEYSREEKLEAALKVALKSLKTYDNHPLIEKQANDALNSRKLCDECGAGMRIIDSCLNKKCFMYVP